MALLESAETVASYQIGQFILKHTDKALWLIEKTSQWALPPPLNVKDDKTLVMSELTRPLPWMLFLPTLLIIRLFREIISIAALLVGKGPIKPIDMVRYIQNCRRSLRAIKYHGIRNIRVKNQNKIVRGEGEDAQGGFSDWMEWFYEKIKELLRYKVVRYSNGKQPKVLRNNSGEPTLVIKKATSHKKRALSPDDSDDEIFDADSALKELASKIDLLPDTDSDDTEYSLKNVSNDLDTSFTSTDDEEENNIDDTQEPEDQQVEQKGPGTSHKLSEPLKKSPKISSKKTEAQQKSPETLQKTSENSKKLSETSQKSPEEFKKPSEVSQKSAEISEKSPEASKKTTEASKKSTAASQKLPEASKKSTETSQKLPEASKKSTEISQKSLETAQKKADTSRTSPKDSPKSTGNNQEIGEVQSEELLINGEMETVGIPSKDENISKVFIEDEKKSTRSNIPINLPGPTSPDQHPTDSDKKDLPKQSKKTGKTSPKTGSPQRENSEILQATGGPKTAADVTTNKSAENPK